MKNQLPLVTIITPTYNRASYLEETIQSVLSQDYPYIDYIVLDDGSTDNTGQILKKYEGQIYWESHPNMGEALSVNKGFAMAKGQIICVVNSDDPLLPGAIREAVALMQKRPDVLAVYSDWEEIGTNSELIKHVRLPQYDLTNMLVQFSVGMGPGTFFRRQAIEMVGMRNPEFRYAGDLEFWFRLALTGNLAHIAKPLATHRVHPESASISDRGPRMAEELVSLVKKVFSHPKLPFHIRVLRRKVFGRVHYSATAYCGYERIASIKHYTISMWYDPKEFAKRMFLKILKFGWDRWRKSYSYKQKTRFTKRASKFAFVSHTLPPSWSGQAVVIKRLLEGMDPNLYCLISQKKNSPDGIERDFIGKVQGRYYTLKKEFQIPWPRQSNLIKRVNILIRIVMRSWRISRILKIENCHAVVAGTGDIADLPAAYIASGLIGTSFFPYLFDDYIHQWREPTIQSLSRFFEPTLLKEASGVIVPNEFLQTEINVRYGIVPSIIRNPYELTDIDFNYCPQSISSESNEIRIVYTGAIYEVNFDAFYNLFEALSYPELQQVKIHIYTSQPIDWLMSHKICGDQVVFHQHVPSLKVREIQASADLLFLPLTFDSPYSEIVRTSAPSKLSDYLASGKPILAHVPSDSYISWYLKIYHCGMVVDQNDSRALSAAIQRIINDVPWAQQLGHNARTHACKDFSPIENRKRFLDLLEKHK